MIILSYIIGVILAGVVGSLERVDCIRCVFNVYKVINDEKRNN